MHSISEQEKLEYASIRELVEQWESSEIRLLDIQSRIEQTLNLALMYGEREFRENLVRMVAEKNTVLRHIEQVVFYLRQKAKQIPHETHS